MRFEYNKESKKNVLVLAIFYFVVRENSGGEMLVSSLLLGIVLLRLLSGSIEVLAALLIYRFNSLEYALRINAMLAAIGPLIFLGAMYLGLTGLTRKVNFNKMIFIYLGVALIFWGLRQPT